jgi:Uma2 family endonuclease
MTEMVPLTTVPLPVKLRAADYRLLDEAGAFEPYGKTELLDGEIVYMNAQHRPHARLKMAMYDVLRDALRDAGVGLSVMVEASILLADHDTPEPDLTLTSEPDGAGLIPRASVALVIEIADATLRSDLGRKASIYARAGVAEYWVADVNGRVIHQLWGPSGVSYAEQRQIAFGEPIIAETVKGLTIDTGAL